MKKSLIVLTCSAVLAVASHTSVLADATKQKTISPSMMVRGEPVSDSGYLKHQHHQLEHELRLNREKIQALQREMKKNHKNKKTLTSLKQMLTPLKDDHNRLAARLKHVNNQLARSESESNGTYRVSDSSKKPPSLERDNRVSRDKFNSASPSSGYVGLPKRNMS